MSVVDERQLKVIEKNRERGLRAVVVGNETLYFPLVAPPEPGMVYVASKRAADVVIAASLLLILLPIFVLIAIAIRLQDGGDIFYYQTRVGRNGKTFRFYKFRSMVLNADEIKAQLEAQNEATGPIFKMKNDPRITPIGRILRRSSFDELPQLLNVLRGEMSLIGPRPHLPR